MTPRRAATSQGAAMVMEVAGGSTAQGSMPPGLPVWSPGHAGRPRRTPGTCSPARSWSPDNLARQRADRTRGDLCLPNARVRLTCCSRPCCACRRCALGSPQNSFANDPSSTSGPPPARTDRFRIRHLKDPAPIAVLEEVAKLAHGAQARGRAAGARRAGRGVARHYDNYAATRRSRCRWCRPRQRKVSVERVACATTAADREPDGLRTRSEGNRPDAFTRAARGREVRHRRVTSLDWAALPIFGSPTAEEIAIALINARTTFAGAAARGLAGQAREQRSSTRPGADAQRAFTP